MEVIIIVFTVIIHNDSEMKQELETSLFFPPFLFFLYLFSHPLMLTHLFASQKDRGPISLSFCYQLLPLATKLWPEVPVSPSPM